MYKFTVIITFFIFLYFIKIIYFHQETGLRHLTNKTYSGSASETGKSFLIRNETKLKFDVRKNCVINNFNLTHTNLSGKINLKKKEIQNLMIIGTEKLTKSGQKRKMAEILDTVIVKALQSYDKY